LRFLKVTVDGEDLVIHILNNLPKQYDFLVEAVEKDLNEGANEEVDVKLVRTRARARFRIIQLR
jgi:gag-polypeptide of LTR copia-type